MEINDVWGLPAHPLIVHAVVVLVPLVALGVVVAVISGSVRARIGWLIVAGAVLNLVLTPLAVGSGEALEERVAESAALEQRADLGEQLLPWVAALAVIMIVYVLLDRRRGKTDSTAGGQSWLLGRPVALTLAVLAVVAAVGSTAMVVAIGHNGAEATWSDVTTAPNGGDTGEDG